MKKIPVLLVCIFWYSISLAQNTGNITLNKGQIFSVETTSNGLVTQEAMGQTSEIKFDINSTNIIEVKNAKDTSYTLSNTITKMKTNMSFMGQEMSYDSEKKEDQDSEMGKNIGKVINHPVDIDINKSGQVVSKNKLADDTTKKSDPGADMMSGMIENIMGNVNDGSSGLTQAFQPIPRKARVGYSWSDSLSGEGSKSNSTYTIKELKGTDAVVVINRKLQITNTAEAEGMEVTNRSTGTVTGEATVDIKSGLVKRKTTTIETKGVVEAMGQEVPVTTKITSVTTVNGK